MCVAGPSVGEKVNEENGVDKRMIKDEGCLYAVEW